MDLVYVFLGQELGGRPKGSQYYDDEGHVYYDKVAQTDLFRPASTACCLVLMTIE